MGKFDYSKVWNCRACGVANRDVKKCRGCDRRARPPGSKFGRPPLYSLSFKLFGERIRMWQQDTVTYPFDVISRQNKRIASGCVVLEPEEFEDGAVTLDALESARVITLNKYPDLPARLLNFATMLAFAAASESCGTDLVAEVPRL